MRAATTTTAAIVFVFSLIMSAARGVPPEPTRNGKQPNTATDTLKQTSAELEIVKKRLSEIRRKLESRTNESLQFDRRPVRID